MIDALSQTTLLGLTTNQTFLIEILSRDFFTSGQTFTTTLESEIWSKPDSPEVARTAAAQILSQRSGDTGSTSGPSDRYSPWRTLGAFRMGS
jgi:acetyl/propionyl-CoA carboxylase alpha subunit